VPYESLYQPRHLFVIVLAIARFQLAPAHVTAAQFNGANQAATGEFVDHSTQRNGMHTCPVNTFMVGIHVDNNLLLCTDAFGDYQGAEFIDKGTQFQGMHACPDGTAMTRIHVDKNWLTCALVAPPATIQLVDVHTQRSGMHACPAGLPMSGIHVDKNWLLCGTQGELRLIDFHADPTAVNTGQFATLSWNVDCSAAGCAVAISGGNQQFNDLALQGSTQVSPTANAEYTLTASSGGGDTSWSVKVAVTSSQPRGVNQLSLFNCSTEKDTVHIWMRDLTAQTAWTEVGTLAPQYDSSGSCPGVGSSGFAVPASGKFMNSHVYAVEAVDQQQIACDGRDDPQEGACIRWTNLTPIVGDSGGPALVEVIS
jgi:hypothetical protein